MRRELSRNHHPREMDGISRELTLKTRVRGFWEEYAQAAGRFYQVIEAGRCGELADEVSAMVREWLPGMGWAFGPGPDGQGHSFTLTPEGNPCRRFVAQYWLGNAPVLRGWTFHASRQAHSFVRSGGIHIAGLDFAADAIWITPSLSAARERVELTVWHPLFPKVRERTRRQVIYIWLDEILGEDGVVNWIGEIRINDQALACSMPLTELPEFIAAAEREHGWEKPPPHEAWTGYSVRDPAAGGLRGDIVAGTTRNFFLAAGYPLREDPLAELGAECVMVVFPVSRLVKGQESAGRGKVEDALSEALRREAGGEVLGGAGGRIRAYIDLVLYDGAVSRKTVAGVLDRAGLGGAWRLEPFAPPVS